MPALGRNPFMTEEDQSNYDDAITQATSEAIAAYDNLSRQMKKSKIAIYARRVIRAIERYVRHDRKDNTLIQDIDLIATLRCVTVLLDGTPTEDYESRSTMTKDVAIKHCFDCANQFDKEFDGHPVAGALIAFIGATLCLASIALFCSSAGLLTPITAAGFILGSTLIASVVSGAGLTAGIG